MLGGIISKLDNNYINKTQNDACEEGDHPVSKLLANISYPLSLHNYFIYSHFYLFY